MTLVILDHDKICIITYLKPLLLIGYTAKGYLTVELTVNYAKAGHASIPERESSITILARAVDRINANQQPNQFGSSIEVAMMERLVPYLPWTVKPFLANLWLFRPLVALAANFDKKILQIIYFLIHVTCIH